MAKFFGEISGEQRDFLEAAPVFFVATAAPEGRINLSPKGYDSLRVLDPRRVAWVNLTGSGNETAAHLPRDDRLTLMVMGFGNRPMILRLFGRARAVHRRDPDWPGLAAALPRLPGARQIVTLAVESVQTSCGYGVPKMKMTAERDTLLRWAEDKGEAGLRRYWAERNAASIDGLPTGIEGSL